MLLPLRCFGRSCRLYGARGLASDSVQAVDADKPDKPLVGSGGDGRKPHGGRMRMMSQGGRMGGRNQNLPFQFRVLDIPGVTQKPPKPPRANPVYRFIPRSQRMSVAHDWTSVWPAARTFHPAAVPLPVRQGQASNLTENDGVAPDKYGNTELIKIPNFLHLTSFHIEKHCASFSHLCSAWPKQISPEQLKEHFPVSITTKDYIRSSHSIRDPRSRRVEISVNLGSFSCLSSKALEFLYLLVGFSKEHYVTGAPMDNPKDNTITLTSERCPTRQQNVDFLMYVLTALVSQSMQYKKLEAYKTQSDNLVFEFKGSENEAKIQKLAETIPIDHVKVEHYAKALDNLLNKGESVEALRQYAEVTKALFNIQTLLPEKKSSI